MPATAWMCGGGRFFCGGAIWRAAGVKIAAATASGCRPSLHCCQTLESMRISRANYDEAVWHNVSFSSRDKM